MAAARTSRNEETLAGLSRQGSSSDSPRRARRMTATLPAVAEQAARVLLDLVAHQGSDTKLTLSWSLPAFEPDTVVGQVPEAADPSAVVAEWARVFDADVTSYGSGIVGRPFTTYQMRARIDGIRVRVWGLVYADVSAQTSGNEVAA